MNVETFAEAFAIEAEKQSKHMMCINAETVYNKYTESITNEIVIERIEKEYDIKILDTKWVLGALFIAFTNSLDSNFNVECTMMVHACKNMNSKILKALWIDDRKTNAHRFNINQKLDTMKSNHTNFFCMGCGMRMRNMEGGI